MVTAAVVVLAVTQAVTVAALVVVLRRLREEQQTSESLRDLMVAAPPNRTRQAAGLAVRTVLDTASRVRERGLLGGLLMAPIEDLTRFLTEDREEIVRVAAPDGTVTVLFSDVEGSTTLNEALGDEEWVRVLQVHDRVVRSAVERQRGHVVKSQGDGFMVVFGAPADAVAAARAIQKAVARTVRLRRAGVRVRIGIHCGPVVARDGDFFGRNVALAARVAAQAGGGEVLVSDDVRVAVGDRVRLRPHGEVELKGFAEPHALWRVG